MLFRPLRKILNTKGLIFLDASRIELYAESNNFIGNQGSPLQSTNVLSTFMDALFGKRRFLILKISSNKNKILKELKNYCMEKEIEFSQLNGQHLTVDTIKGELEVIHENGRPIYTRKAPDYISNNKQLIVVPDLSSETDLAILKAFLYMGELGAYYDDIENLPGE